MSARVAVALAGSLAVVAAHVVDRWRSTRQGGRTASTMVVGQVADERLRIRIEASYKNLERAIGFVANADAKAMIAFAYQGVLLAAVAAASGPAHNFFIARRESTAAFTLYLLFSVLIVAFALYATRGFRAIFPDLDPSELRASGRSLFYFGSISRLSLKEFTRQN